MFECNLPELFQIPRQTLLKFRKFHLARTTFHVTRLHEIPLYTAMQEYLLSYRDSRWILDTYWGVT